MLTAKPAADWQSLHAAVKTALHAGGFDQVPLLSGPQSVLERPVFS